MSAMRQKEICPHCQPAPISHTLNRWEHIIHMLLRPYMYPLEALRRKLLPIFSSKNGKKLKLGTLKLFLSSGIVRAIPRPTENETMRTLCFWEEADRRGIKMSRLALFNLPSNLFMAQYRGRTRVFEGLARPDGLESDSLEWMDDKGVMREKFKAAGFPVALGGVCATKKTAIGIFNSIGTPVIVKPHSGSRSRHTTIHISNVDDLLVAFRIAKQLSSWVVIEEQLQGMVHRGTVIGGKLFAVIRREPPHVYGDGKSTVRELVNKENQNPKRHGPVFHEIASGSEAELELKRQGLKWESVPKAGELVTFNQKISRGLGGSTTDLTDSVHADNIKLFEDIAAFLGEPLVGIDFIISDIKKSWRETQKCGVIECNSLPFIDLHHYPLVGEARNAAGALWDIVFPSGLVEVAVRDN